MVGRPHTAAIYSIVSRFPGGIEAWLVAAHERLSPSNIGLAQLSILTELKPAIFGASRLGERHARHSLALGTPLDELKSYAVRGF
jgi:hypothetical protein